MYLDAVHNAQRVLREFAGYTDAIDGKPGVKSLFAAARIGVLDKGWPPRRRVICAAQVALAGAGYDVGKVDGLWGVRTHGAYLAWQAAKGLECLPDRTPENDWGTQAQVSARFGAAGSTACTAGKVEMPWPTVLAWDTSQHIRRFSCHVAVAESAQRVLDKVATLYSLAEIVDLGLHRWGGCYNYRAKRGGRSLSMHAWGLAIDFDPGRNRLNWGNKRARLAAYDAKPWWDAWEAEGWLSLGRTRNFDWMHVQAPGLS